MSDRAYFEVEHTADWSLHVRGASFDELLINAAKGMVAYLELTKTGKQPCSAKIEVEALDREDLLVAWLEELLYRIEVNSVTFESFEIEKIEDTNLTATIVEVPAATPRRAIKAVTYHGLEIQESSSGLEATIVFDV